MDLREKDSFRQEKEGTLLGFRGEKRWRKRKFFGFFLKEFLSYSQLFLIRFLHQLENMIKSDKISIFLGGV